MKQQTDRRLTPVQLQRHTESNAILYALRAPARVTHPDQAMAAAVNCAAPQPQRYQRLRPEQTLWYRTVQAHFATWLELSIGPAGESPPAYVERSFRR